MRSIDKIFFFLGELFEDSDVPYDRDWDYKLRSLLTDPSVKKTLDSFQLTLKDSTGKEYVVRTTLYWKYGILESANGRSVYPSAQRRPGLKTRMILTDVVAAARVKERKSEEIDYSKI